MGQITKVQFQNYRLSLLIEYYRNMIWFMILKVSTKLKIQLNLLKKYFGEFTGKGGWKIDLTFGEILFQKTISILILTYMKVQLMEIQK